MATFQIEDPEVQAIKEAGRSGMVYLGNAVEGETVRVVAEVIDGPAFDELLDAVDDLDQDEVEKLYQKLAEADSRRNLEQFSEPPE